MPQELFLCEKKQKKTALPLKNKQVVFLYVYLINLNRIGQFGSTPEPAIRSCNTGQWILCFDSCQLITTLMCNIRFAGSHTSITLARKCNVSHWFPLVRTGGWMYGQVTSKLSCMYSNQIFLAMELRCHRD